MPFNNEAEVDSSGVKQPFEIRAHHALKPALFGRERNIVGVGSDLTEQFINWYGLDPKSVTYKSVYDLLRRDPRMYVIDILGKDPKGYAQIYESQMFAYLLRFSQLADTDPINLITGKDGICNSCAVGNHCKDPKEIEQEQFSMRRFIGVAIWSFKPSVTDFLPVYDESNRLIRIETNKVTVVEVASNVRKYEERLNSSPIP